MISRKMQKLFIENFPYILIWMTIYLVLFYFLPPKYLFINSYVGGGDLGSHQTALKEMVNHIWPGFFGWTNVWYLGMPLFTFYFPLPFWLGALLAKLTVPLAVSFKLITMVGVFALPLTAYYFAKKIQMKTPIFAAVFSLAPLLLASNAIVGGSIQSTFAGEFTHLWSINFLLLFLGLAWEKKKIILPAIFLGAMILSHTLSLVFVVVFIALWWFLAERKKEDLFYYLKVFGLGLLLVSWWLVPFLIYRQYSTDLGYFAGRDLWDYLYKERLLWLAFVFILFSHWRSRQNWYFIILLATAIGLWQFLPADIGVWLPRFIAYYLLFIFLFMGQNIFLAENRKSVWLESALAILSLVLIVFLADNRFLTGNYKYAMEPPFPDSVKAMVSELNALPKGRVLFEYDDAVSVFFSPRGYELLPVFANQDTVAGLYLESALSTPAAYLAMAEISVHKEQVGNYFQLLSQEKIKPENAYEHLKFLSIRYIIAGKNRQFFLDHPEQYQFIKNFDENLYLFEVKNIEPLMTLAKPPTVNQQKMTKIEREKYYIDWLLKGDFTPEILSKKPVNIDSLHNFYATENVPQPAVEISNTKIIAKNLLANQPYWLKISYFPAWKSKDAKIYHSAPGLMLVIPQKETIELNYKPLGI